MQFSLFFFSEDTGARFDGYQLLFQSARLADELGFSAVWTPERHFHRFGGGYPNPSLLAGALAMVTRRVELRAGSVVIPLHHPIRVAEEWSVVDNLSGGRVGIACATGWHRADFVFAPDQYASRKDVTWRNLEILRRLWKGEELPFKGVEGRDVPIVIFPRPIQPELPVWVTASGSVETFRKAGALGAHLLTHLSAQGISELAEHVGIYRAALAAHGHDPTEHRVTVMAHTFVGESDHEVRDLVRAPMHQYLRSNLELHARQARERDPSLSVSQFTADDQRSMLEHAFEKYYRDRALFGTVERCRGIVDRLLAAGVNEIACLVDFGLDIDAVLNSLRSLSSLIPSAPLREPSRLPV